MKNFSCILILLMMFSACEKADKKTDGYIVNGTAKGVYNGIRVYLKDINIRGKETVKDTAVVMNEKFSFQGKIDGPQLQYLSINSIKGVIPIMLDNAEITVNVDKENLENSEVTGTKANKAISDYSSKINNISKERMVLANDFKKAQETNDSASMEALKEKGVANTAKLERYPVDFVEKNPDNFYSLSVIENVLRTHKYDLDKLIELYNGLSKKVKGSTYGRSVYNSLITLKAEADKLEVLSIGKPAPKFSAPQPNGTQLALNDLKGKVTIIDFWASWCRPCRMENPNVVKVYNNYHDKGLEIISVSLDKPGQKDRWIKAIADDNLTWHHVSNLNYFNDPVAKMYNIQSIPSTFILDSEGNIVAKNLRGIALENKIAELLN